MSNRYSPPERFIAVILGKLPILKRLIKYLYSRLNYCFVKKVPRYTSPFKLLRFGDENKESFFGYYDKSPLNFSGDIVLYHETNRATNKLPSGQEPIYVVAKQFLKDGKEFRFVTSSYNWQQGSRVQWIDNDKFIFNDFDRVNEVYCSHVICARTGLKERTFDFPIYDVHHNFGYTLNFDRLALLRPDYGYRNRKELGKKIDLKDLTNDGVFYFDMEKNTYELIISLDFLSTVFFDKKQPSALHKVNHIMISPSGRKFVFLHRYFINGRKFDRLILSDRFGKNIKVLANNDMVSHYFWKNDDILVAYMRDFKEGDKYYEIDVNTGEYTPVGVGVIDMLGDGHPNIYQDLMLFDTYPNRARMKELFIFHLSNNQLEKVGDFFESFKFSEETRCDLHPRFSDKGDWIFFDSLHTGKRHLYGVKLS